MEPGNFGSTAPQDEYIFLTCISVSHEYWRNFSRLQMGSQSLKLYIDFHLRGVNISVPAFKDKSDIFLFF